MDYEKHYNLLMEKGRTQTLPDRTYVEKHHILPASLGGTKAKTNIVTLTAKQHYIAHALLVKIYQVKCVNGVDKTPYYKMLRAFTSMIWRWGNPKENKRALKNAKMYESWKKELIEYYKICNKEWIENLTTEERKEHGEKISVSLKNFYTTHDGSFTGKKHSKETIQKMKEHRMKYHPGKGSKNSHYGTKWISNIEMQISKRIDKTEPIPDGWVVGRIQDWNKYNQKQKDKKDKQLKKEEKNLELKRLYSMYYEEYQKSGFKGVVEKFGYKYSKANFSQMCKKYLV